MRDDVACIGRLTRKALPDQALLNRLLSYEQNTGLLTWLSRDAGFASERCVSLKYIAAWNASHAGREARTVLRHGYIGLTILGIHYMAHRVIWKMVHGIDADHIDHINGDKGDNRLVNLRNVDATGNARNRKTNSNNASGHSGVHWCRTNRKFVARIRHDGAVKMLGRFSEINDAIAARRLAEQNLWFSAAE